MSTTPIRAGLRESSSLHEYVKDGLQAVDRAHLAYIDEGIRKDFADSLEVDEHLKKDHEQENRWDYLLGHKSSRCIVGLEPHSANNHEITTVIRKRAHALKQLRNHLRDGVIIREWFWVASGKVDFTPLDKKVTQLTNSGITFVGTHLLAKRLGTLKPAANVAKPQKTTKKRKR